MLTAAPLCDISGIQLVKRSLMLLRVANIYFHVQLLFMFSHYASICIKLGRSVEDRILPLAKPAE